MDIRLRLYTPQGVRGRVLKTTSIGVTDTYGETPTVTFQVSSRVAGYLEQPFVVAVEYSRNGGAWTEPRNGRFVITDDNTDVANINGIVTFNGVGLVQWLLAHTHLHWSSSARNGERQWTKQNAGYILVGMILEAHNQGWAPYVTCDFTQTHDSNGVAWSTAAADLISPAYPLLMPLSEVLSGLVADGMCEAATDGTVLHLYVPATGTDHATGSKPVMLGPGATAAPVKSNFNDVFTDLTVVPEKARNWVYLTNPGANSTFGRLEATMTQSGVKDAVTATKLAQATLTLGKTSKREGQLTYEAQKAKWLPWIHYQNGDMVKAKLRGGWEPLRVVQLVITKKDTVTVTTVLSHRFRSLLSKVSNRTGKSSIGKITGGSGVPLPSGARPPAALPAAPDGLAVTGNVGVWDPTGLPKAKLTVTWNAVTSDVDGAEIDVDTYELWLREADDTARRLLSTTGLTGTRTLESLVTVFFKVRTRAVSGDWSDFSPEVQVTTVTPTDVLDAPSAPTLTQKLGVVTVRWDGELSTGFPPVQFRSVRVERSLNGGGFVAIGAPMGHAGAVTDADVPADATATYRLIATDSRGVQSAPSVTAEITVSSDVSDAKLRQMADDIIVNATGITEAVATAAADAQSKADAARVAAVQAAALDASAKASAAQSAATAAAAADAQSKADVAKQAAIDAAATAAQLMADGAAQDAIDAAAADAQSKANAAESAATSAAALDAQAKADAAKAAAISAAAADATTKANAATAVANTAQQAADAALAAASGAAAAASLANGRITISTAAPVTADGSGKPVGAVWWRKDGTGNIVGQWEWSGNAWDLQGLSHEVVASIDLGKGIFGELDGQYLKANTVNAEDALVVGSSIPTIIRDGGITTAALKARSVTSDKAAVGFLQAEHVALGARLPTGEAVNRVPAPLTDQAYWAKVIDRTIGWAYGNPTNVSATPLGIQISPTATDRSFMYFTALNPVPESRQVYISAVQSTQIVGVSWRDAAGVFISASVVPASGVGALTAPDNAVTYTVDALENHFPGESGGLVQSLKVFEVIGGKTGQQYVAISPQGIEMGDDSGAVSMRLGTWDDDLIKVMGTSPEGNPVQRSALDSDGGGTFEDVVAFNGGLSVVGTDLVGGLNDAQYNGQDYDGALLDRLGRGTIYSAIWGAPVGNVTAQYQRIASGMFVLEGGRDYLLDCYLGGLQTDNTSGQNQYVEMRISLSPMDPGTSGERLFRAVVYAGTKGNWVFNPVVRSAHSGPNLKYEYLPDGVPIYWQLNTNSVSAHSGFLMQATALQGQFSIIDAGQTKAPTIATDHTTSGNQAPPPAQPATTVFTAAWSATWDSGGNRILFNGGPYADQRLVQGGGSGGTRYSQIGFNALGLSGKTPTGMWIRLKNRHIGGSGSSSIQFGAHGYTSAGSRGTRSGAWNGSTNSGQDKWHPIPSGLWGGFMSGSYRGITLGDDTGGTMSNYGIFDGVASSNPYTSSPVIPQLKVSYT